MNFPISIISHSSTIPANSPDYVEKFEKIEFPNRDLFDLRITSITAKVDTTALYNIIVQNKVVVVHSGNIENETFTINPGYYSLQALSTALNGHLRFDSNNVPYVHNTCLRVDFAEAPDFKRICRISGHYIDQGQILTGSADVSRGRNVLKVYSSINEQPMNNQTTTLCDIFVYKAVGLNNTITYDNLNIAVHDANTIDNIKWSLRDRNDNPLNIDAPVYINFTISVIAK